MKKVPLILIILAFPFLVGCVGVAPYGGFGGYGGQVYGNPGGYHSGVRGNQYFGDYNPGTGATRFRKRPGVNTRNHGFYRTPDNRHIWDNPGWRGNR
ncbi:hypothetical protein H6777_01880 [Candidatus Nomurabacteria bacterium]|nr:hypothetical protein [Candidatus Nomurabacteria bacterium]